MTDLLEVCRICLANDVRMFKILNTNLQDIYEKLTDISFSNDDGRPLYACYMCHAHLRKCYNFRMKSLRANKALTRLLSNDIKLTYKSIQLVDRCAHKLVDNFSISCLLDLDIKPHLNEDKEIFIVKQEHVSIKHEEIEPEALEYGEHTNTDVTEIVETNRQLDYEFDGDYKVFSDLGNEREVENYDFAHINAAQQTESTQLYRKQKLEIQKRNPDEVRTQSKTEEQDVNTFANINSKHNVNLTVIPSDTKTITTDKAKHENNLTRNAIIEMSNTNVKKFLENVNVPQSDSMKNNDLFICNDCGEECSTKTDLTTHIEAHKLQNQDIYFKCDTCSYKSLTKDSLNKHLVFHDKDRPFVCDHCGYRFVKEIHLKSHTKIHTGNKPYACNICEYKTKHRSNLITHRRKHSGDKPYVCNFCEYKCKPVADLHICRQ